MRASPASAAPPPGLRPPPSPCANSPCTSPPPVLSSVAETRCSHVLGDRTQIPHQNAAQNLAAQPGKSLRYRPGAVLPHRPPRLGAPRAPGHQCPHWGGTLYPHRKNGGSRPHPYRAGKGDLPKRVRSAAGGDAARYAASLQGALGVPLQGAHHRDRLLPLLGKRSDTGGGAFRPR